MRFYYVNLLDFYLELGLSSLVYLFAIQDRIGEWSKGYVIFNFRRTFLSSSVRMMVE